MYQFQDFVLSEDTNGMLTIVARFAKGKVKLMPGIRVPKDASLSQFREALVKWVATIEKSETHLLKKGR